MLVRTCATDSPVADHKALGCSMIASCNFISCIVASSTNTSCIASCTNKYIPCNVLYYAYLVLLVMNCAYYVVFSVMLLPELVLPVMLLPELVLPVMLLPLFRGETDVDSLEQVEEAMAEAVLSEPQSNKKDCAIM